MLTGRTKESVRRRRGGDERTRRFMNRNAESRESGSEDHEGKGAKMGDVDKLGIARSRIGQSRAGDRPGKEQLQLQQACSAEDGQVESHMSVSALQPPPSLHSTAGSHEDGLSLPHGAPLISDVYCTYRVWLSAGAVGEARLTASAIIHSRTTRLEV